MEETGGNRESPLLDFLTVPKEVQRDEGEYGVVRSEVRDRSG